MSDQIEEFSNSAQAVAAFKITARALIEQGDAAVSQADPAGDAPYNSIRDLARNIPFAAAAPSYGEMLETIPSPLAERIATLAVEHSKKYDTMGEQIVYQLHLADISERVPGLSDELTPARALRDDVREFLMDKDFLPHQAARIHEEAEAHLKELSVEALDILVDSLHNAIGKLSTLDNPSPNLAERLYALLEGTPGADNDHRYGEATVILFDLGTNETKRAILNARIGAAHITPEDEEPVQRDPILSRFGQTLADFENADGTLKTADYFIFNPQSAGRTLPLDFGPDGSK